MYVFGSGWGCPNDTAYKRCSCHSGLKLLCKLCRTSPPPAMGDRCTVFLGMPAGWLALLLTKAGNVETNPGPTTFNKKTFFWIFVILKLHILFGYCVDENGVSVPWLTNQEPLFSFMHGRSSHLSLHITAPPGILYT